MQSIGIMVDQSYSCEQVVKDLLAINNHPLLICHIGFYGRSPLALNISDELMQQIAASGGLIDVGYWAAAVREFNVNQMAKTIQYGIELVGNEHVALDSNYDGATSVPFNSGSNRFRPKLTTS